MHAFTRGKKVRSNLLRLKVKDADAAVLGSVRHHLLDREVIERAMREAIKRMRSGGGADTRRQELQQRLGKVEAEAANLVKAIAKGGEMASLLAAVKEREQKASQLRA
jgi:hypothetical protein